MNTQPQKKIDRRARLKLPPIHAGQRSAEERVRDFEEILVLHTPALAQAEAGRCLHCPQAPCQQACPLHNDIPRALALLEEGDIAGAANVYRETNPLPEICGRICPQHFCQDACTLNKMGKPIDTRHLEAFVATYQSEHLEIPRPAIAPATGKRVAIVGGGPAGLAVAEFLTCKGHAVCVYEQYAQPGGLLLYGIPNFKLNKALVEAKIHRLETLGVRFQCDTAVGQDITVPALQEEYDALFLGIGASIHIRPGLPGEELQGVYEAIEFLCRTNLPPEILPPEWQEPFVVGPRVHVLGGGNTAVDCLRSAVRWPGVREATCYYRRSQTEMPATEEEYQHAVEEGANFVWLACPTQFLGNAEGQLEAVVYQRMQLGEPDESGRRRPEPIPGQKFTIKADTVVLALGSRPDKTFAARVPGLVTHRRGMLEVDTQQTGRTGAPGVFAAGDVVRGADLLAPVLADALHVAETMDAYLTGAEA